MLNITFFVRGKNYLIDSGRYTYRESEEREYLKSSNGHNTIIIDKEENSKYRDSWTNETEANFIDGIYFEKENINVCSSYNLAYIKKGYIITRTLVRFSKEAFLILDYVLGDGYKNIEIKFNTPLEVMRKNDFLCISDLKLIVSENADIKIKYGYYSKHYNEKLSSKKIVENVSCENIVFIYNFFSFYDEAKIEKVVLHNQLNKIIPKTVAVGLKITFQKDEYIVLYRPVANPLNRGYFIKFEDKYYIESLIILKKTKNKYIEISKIIL